MTEILPGETKSCEPFHYSHRAFFVGLFSIIPLIVLLSIVIVHLVRIGYLEQWLDFEIRCNEVYNLQVGADVIFRGVVIGTIRDICLTEDDYVRVVIKIREKHFPLIKSGCKAVLEQKKLLIGDWQIRLEPEENSLVTLKAGAVIPFQSPLSLDMRLAPLEKLLLRLDEIVTRVQSPDGLLGKLLHENTLFSDVETMKLRMVNILEQIDEMLQKANVTLGSADIMIEHMTQFGQNGTSTVQTFNEVGLEAAQLVEKLEGLLNNLNSLSSRLHDFPPEIQETFDLLKRDLIEAEILLEGMQNHWLLKNSMKKTRDARQSHTE